MDKKIGFIGCGNMGEAILKGITTSFDNSENIYIYTKTEKTQSRLQENYKINILKSSVEVARTSDIIFLAVKPNIFPTIMNEIKNVIDNSKIIISIAAGVTIDTLENGLGKNNKIIRTMPNTPASVGMGMTSFSPNKNITKDDLVMVQEILKSFGLAEEVDESLIHSVIGVSGSSPAYVFMFIESMADAAVKGGMPRDKAYKFAAQSIMGAAKMVLDTGIHPGVLKDMVCSPGGTTIEAVAELERTGFRNSIISAMTKCMNKSKEMSKN